MERFPLKTLTSVLKLTLLLALSFETLSNMYYSLVFASIPRVHIGCVAFVAAAAVVFAQVTGTLLPLTAVDNAYTYSHLRATLLDLLMFRRCI